MKLTAADLAYIRRLRAAARAHEANAFRDETWGRRDLALTDARLAAAAWAALEAVGRPAEDVAPTRATAEPTDASTAEPRASLRRAQDDTTGVAP